MDKEDPKQKEIKKDQHGQRRPQTEGNKQRGREIGKVGKKRVFNAHLTLTVISKCYCGNTEVSLTLINCFTSM